mgnify:CR=1 FL=1
MKKISYFFKRLLTKLLKNFIALAYKYNIYLREVRILSKHTLYILPLLLIYACGGGGGGGGSDSTTPTPTPTVTITSSASEVILGESATITWSSTNATSCAASNSWTSSTATSGTGQVTISNVGDNTFSMTCSGAGGERSASVTIQGYRTTDGVVVDGYISGAEVCIDEDESFTCDDDENSTTSDNDGKFTIKYANGNLVSIGGTDLDSQTLLDNLLITHKLSGHSDFKAITPVTSVAAFLCTTASDVCAGGGTDINTVLGIDTSLDVYTVDPVANKGDGGVYDFLYEKGNQLTALAFVMQNITNDLNNTSETTEDYFKSIAEVLDVEYLNDPSKVDIETEDFVTKVLDNVITAKSLDISDTVKTNTSKAISGLLPVIEVKSSDNLTTSVIRFALSTFQDDLKSIANGTASQATIASYLEDVLNYIATDQNIDSGDIAPDISAISDSATTDEDTSVSINVLTNDSYLTSAPISVSVETNPSNGSISITDNLVTYLPNSNFHGTDSFNYKITQGDKTSSALVSLTINPVNDAPVIDIASTISVDENQTSVTTVSVSDPDEDDLTLSVGGTDATSFNLSSDNILTFKEAPDYEAKNAYSISLSLTDGAETVTKSLTINITNVNDNSPVITSDATFTAAENQIAIGTLTAADSDGDVVAFTISGTELAITSAGVLTFVTSPDYENKSSYTATITATDGLYAVTQDITVNVTNVNDNSPVITSDATFTAAENQTAIGTVIATDADGDNISYSISGNEIEISSTGVLTFVSTPDYETKTSYTATVTVSDGTNAATQDITVTITNDESDDAVSGIVLPQSVQLVETQGETS